VSSKNKVHVLIAVHGHSNRAQLYAGSGKYTVFRILIECTDTLWVVVRVHSVEQAQVCKVINIDPAVKNDSYPKKVSLVAHTHQI